MPRIFISILLISILTGFFIFLGYNFLYKVNQSDEKLQLKIGGKDFYLDVARTDEERGRGLAKFDSIKDNEGMLFIFDVSGKYSFYMKDMKFNIDIIFLNENKEIVNIFKNVKFTNYQNPREYEIYKPDYPSKYVIELKEGQIQKLDIKVGDKIDFQTK